MADRLLTTYAAGQWLDLSSAEVLKLAKEGAFGAIKRNGAGHVLIPSAAVEAYRAQRFAENPQVPPPEPVAVPSPAAEAESPPPPSRRERSDDAIAAPPPSRRRPRRASDPLPGSGRTQIVLEPLRQYQSAENFGPELVRLRAGLKVLLCRYGLRCRELKFLDEGEAA